MSGDVAHQEALGFRRHTSIIAQAPPIAEARTPLLLQCFAIAVELGQTERHPVLGEKRRGRQLGTLDPCQPLPDSLFALYPGHCPTSGFSSPAIRPPRRLAITTGLS